MYRAYSIQRVVRVRPKIPKNDEVDSLSRPVDSRIDEYARYHISSCRSLSWGDEVQVMIAC